MRIGTNLGKGSLWYQSAVTTQSAALANVSVTSLFSASAQTATLILTPTTAPSSVEGYVYYDSAAHKLKVRGVAGFETVTSI